MSRVIDPDVVAALQARVVRPISFIELLFDGGDFRTSTGIGDIEWGGHTWTGTGVVIGISPVDETQSLESRSAQLTVSGVPSEIITIALAEPYQGRPAKIYLGFMDENDQLIGDPIVLFIGAMDTMEIAEDGGQSTIAITLEHSLAALTRAKPRRYTPEDQKELYPSDRGLDFVPSLQDKEITWTPPS